MMAKQERPFAMVRQPFELKRVRRALDTLPLADADLAATGRRSPCIEAVRLWSIAHRFRRGRRIRVQVSGRPEHPSAVLLPVRAAAQAH
ncbi:hypothetical protein [Streptomyces sp. 11x1]|uniref:hypothetical protein n=1 Tax=Streptomyces sp. 11x1 TaxID=3038642 RepID=UPI00292E6FD3|nr:hypothetical protein [Streptomyces sp. 11x1]WNZ07068.1 hypothetical protein P8T65_05300 [Streptomyces sp. 11x1]